MYIVMTVKQMIRQPYMAGVIILDGEEYLSNIILGVTFFSDAKNNLFLKNVVVLMTEDEFQEMNIEERRSCLTRLGNKKIAALIIKPERNPRELSSSIREIGMDRQSFPTLILTEDVFLPSVIRGIDYDIIYSQGYSFDRTYEDNLLQDLIFAEQDVDELRRRIRMMGIRVNEYLCVFLIKVAGENNMQRLMDNCREFLGQTGFTNCRNHIVLIMVRSLRDFRESEEYFKKFAKELYSFLKRKYKGARTVIGVGHVYENQIEVRKSYLSAKTALLAGWTSNGKDIVLYDNMGIYKILYHLKNRKELFELKSDTVGRIQEYDKKNHTEYYETIQAYVDNFFSIQNTAKQLYVQYNTIRYRISKINEELGWNLFDREDCLYLALGYQAEKFLVENQSF